MFLVMKELIHESVYEAEMVHSLTQTSTTVNDKHIAHHLFDDFSMREKDKNPTWITAHESLIQEKKSYNESELMYTTCSVATLEISSSITVDESNEENNCVSHPQQIDSSTVADLQAASWIYSSYTMDQFQPPIGILIDDLQSGFRMDTLSVLSREQIHVLHVAEEKALHSEHESFIGKHVAYQVFDGFFLRQNRFQQRSKLRLSPKSWMFKFKTPNLQRGSVQVGSKGTWNNFTYWRRKKHTMQRIISKPKGLRSKQKELFAVILTENVLIDPADQKQKQGDAAVESNEKYYASDIIEKVKAQDGISREFEVNIEEKVQEENKEIAECNEEVPAVLSLSELLSVVKILSAEKQEECNSQQDVNSSISENKTLQDEQKEKKAETHETVKEEDRIVENKEEKKSEEEQDEKLWDFSATRYIEEFFPSEVKDDKEVHSVMRSEKEINEVVISEKFQIKHKWRVQLLNPVSKLELCLESVKGVVFATTNWKCDAVCTGSDNLLTWDKETLLQSPQYKKKFACVALSTEYFSVEMTFIEETGTEGETLQQLATVLHIYETQKQRALGQSYPLVVAEHWSPQMHFEIVCYQVWHRWKARYLQLGEYVFEARSSTRCVLKTWLHTNLAYSVWEQQGKMQLSSSQITWPIDAEMVRCYKGQKHMVLLTTWKTCMPQSLAQFGETRVQQAVLWLSFPHEPGILILLHPFWFFSWDTLICHKLEDKLVFGDGSIDKVHGAYFRQKKETR